MSRLAASALCIAAGISLSLLGAALLIAVFDCNDLQAGLGGGFAGCWAISTLMDLIDGR